MPLDPDDTLDPEIDLRPVVIDAERSDNGASLLDPYEDPPTIPLSGPGADPYDTLAGAEVPCVPTPLTREALREALCAGHVAAFGVEPPWPRLACAWAQCREEHGDAGYHSNNLGNIDATKDWGGDWFRLTAPEGSGATEKLLTKRLRAHADAVTGAQDYWLFLAERYPTALRAFDRGAPAEAAAELKHPAGARWGWFTGDLAAYQRAMVALVHEFRAAWPEPSPSGAA